jgi:hypothetical protein
LVVQNIEAILAGSSSLTANVITVATPQELREALRQTEKQIVITDPALARKIDAIVTLGKVAIVGWLLAWVARDLPLSFSSTRS